MFKYKILTILFFLFVTANINAQWDNSNRFENDNGWTTSSNNAYPPPVPEPGDEADGPGGPSSVFINQYKYYLIIIAIVFIGYFAGKMKKAKIKSNENDTTQPE